MSPKPTLQNNQSERIKAGASIAIIVISLSYTAIKIKNQLFPSASSGPAVASNPTPPPVTSGSTPAGSPGVTTVAAAGPSAPASGAAAPAEEVLPKGPVKIVVRDPFSMSANYRKRVPLKNGTMLASAFGMKPPKGLSTTFSTTFKSHPLRGLAPSLAGLPPAQFNLESLKERSHRGLPEMGAPRGLPEVGTSRKAGASSSSSQNSGGSEKDAGVKEKRGESYVLTGTVDGEVPMAILRSNAKSYLVHEGDWLEGDYQVRRVQPRQVVLRDRTGRRKVLSLGGSTPNAI